MRLVFAFIIFPALLSGQQVVLQPYGQVPGQVSGGILGARPAGGQPQQKPVSSDCAVDGSVVNKITGEPVPRAQVMLMGQGGQSVVSADSSGRWSFSNISCGQNQVMVNRPGYLSAMSGAPQLGALFHPMILAGGSSTHNIKIELIPQAVVVGRVRDDQGDPVPNAQVSAMASRVVQGRRTFQAGNSAQTNDLGEFRLANLQGGRYIICARGMNQMNGMMNDSTMSGESCYPGPLEGGAASAMQLGSGTDTRVDFTLPKVPTVHVRGMVVGIPKIQGGGVGVNLVKRGIAMAGPVGNHPAAVQPDGKFVVAGVTPGSYTLTTDYWEAGKRLTARVPVEVGNSDLEDVTVRLEAGFTVSGTVRYESRAGGSGGLPPNQQFNINLHTSDGMMGGGGVQWNKDHTAFTVPDLPPGSYRMDGFAQGRFYVKSALLGGRDLSKEEVTIGQPAGPIDVVLSDDSGAVEGQVVDAGDQPVSSWVMVLAEGRQPRNIMTDAGGSFKLSGLAPGDYKLYAWDDVQQVEFANPEWMRRYAGISVSVQPDQSAQAKLKQMAVEAR